MRQPRRSSSRRFSRTSEFIGVSTVCGILYNTYCITHSTSCQGKSTEPALSGCASLEGGQTGMLFGRIYCGSDRSDNDLRLVQVNGMPAGRNHDLPAVG